MRILSISAQKPSSTGSGVFLTEVVKALEKQGHEQAVVAGVYKNDEIPLTESIDFYPVYFDTEELPFHVVGMSDEMPYPSTRYCDMTEKMVSQFEKAFLKVLKPLIDEFQPDLILSHHLYLLTSIVRNHFPDQLMYGFCHNTDLRQLEKNALKKEYIKQSIPKLHRVFALHDEQKERILSMFEINENMVIVTGMGYNSDVFKLMPEEKVDDGIKRVVFAGKIAEKKGVVSLLKSLQYLKYQKEELEIFLAGGAGNQEEYEQILSLAETTKYQVHFLGRLNQSELAKVYNRCDVFLLPSYYEGLPLTVIEALACGNRVVVSDIPGVKPWLTANTKHADISYVTLPTMINADEPIKEELPAFEHRIAQVLTESLDRNEKIIADVSDISWVGLANKIIQK